MELSKTAVVDIYYTNNTLRELLIAVLNTYDGSSSESDITKHVSDIGAGIIIGDEYLPAPYMSVVPISKHNNPTDIKEAMRKLFKYNLRYDKPYMDGYAIVNDIQYDIYFHKVL